LWTMYLLRSAAFSEQKNIFGGDQELSFRDFVIFFGWSGIFIPRH